MTVYVALIQVPQDTHSAFIHYFFSTFFIRVLLPQEPNSMQVFVRNSILLDDLLYICNSYNVKVIHVFSETVHSLQC